MTWSYELGGGFHLFDENLKEKENIKENIKLNNQWILKEDMIVNDPIEVNAYDGFNDIETLRKFLEIFFQVVGKYGYYVPTSHRTSAVSYEGIWILSIYEDELVDMDNDIPLDSAVGIYFNEKEECEYSYTKNMKIHTVRKNRSGYLTVTCLYLSGEHDKFGGNLICKTIYKFEGYNITMVGEQTL